MTEGRRSAIPGAPDHSQRQRPSLAPRLRHPLDADGLYARSEDYNAVIDGVDRALDGLRPQTAETLRFPPVMSRAIIEKSGYLKSFPNLLGCVCALSDDSAASLTFEPGDRAKAPWTDALTVSDLVLTPAACYPLYPIVAGEGRLPAGGRVFDVACHCFRREPSKDIDRLQAFRMREFVYIGAEKTVIAERDAWTRRATAWFRTLCLPSEIALANDPFFGAGRKVRVLLQRQQALKYELLTPLLSDGPPSSCMSFNYHKDHFGDVWDLRDVTGARLHTACVGFGLDRIATALFVRHGDRPNLWPSSARRALRL